MPKPTWLWCLSTKMLSRERALRAELWRLRREYEPWIDEVSGQERESRIGEYLHMRDEVLEKLELLATQRLSRRAAKYPTVVIPRITMSGKHHQDENWEHGHVTGTWDLKRAAYASVLR